MTQCTKPDDLSLIPKPNSARESQLLEAVFWPPLMVPTNTHTECNKYKTKPELCWMWWQTEGPTLDDEQSFWGFYYFILLFLFEIGSHYELTGFELKRSACLYFLCTEIKGICHHTQSSLCFWAQSLTYILGKLYHWAVFPALPSFFLSTLLLMGFTILDLTGKRFIQWFLPVKKDKLPKVLVIHSLS